MTQQEYQSICRQLASLSAQLGGIDRALRGDGQDRLGLIARVARIERTLTAIHWAIGIIFGAVVTALVGYVQ